MPIFEKENKRVLFVRVPKTAGTSINGVFNHAGWKISLDGWVGNHAYFNQRSGSLTHLTYREIEEYYNIADFDFVFSIVVNPYEKITSEYNWQKETSNFDEWFDRQVNEYTLDKNFFDRHFLPQHEFIGQHTSCVYKLEQGLQEICSDIETELDTVFPHKNVWSNVSDKRIDSSQINKHKVYEMYKKDFDLFGYTK